MTKTFVAFIGIGLLVSALIFTKNLNKAKDVATSLDKEEVAYGFIEGPPPCTWEVEPPEKVVSENKSQALVISTSNPVDVDCQTTLSLHAPGFDAAPPKVEQIINLKPNGQGSLSWILTPRRAGIYDIAVSDGLNTKVFGISVTNMLGLSAVQAKLASGLGTLFGPMLTVPWWWDRFRRKKEKQNEQKLDPQPPQ